MHFWFTIFIGTTLLTPVLPAQKVHSESEADGNWPPLLIGMIGWLQSWGDAVWKGSSSAHMLPEASSVTRHQGVETDIGEGMELHFGFMLIPVFIFAGAADGGLCYLGDSCDVREVEINIQCGGRYADLVILWPMFWSRGGGASSSLWKRRTAWGLVLCNRERNELNCNVSATPTLSKSNTYFANKGQAVIILSTSTHSFKCINMLMKSNRHNFILPPGDSWDVSGVQI